MDAFAIDQLGNIRVKNSAILDREKTKSIQCQVGSALQNVNMVHLHRDVFNVYSETTSTETLKGAWSKLFFLQVLLYRF